MKLTKEASAILGRTSIGMLALRSGRLPLVNPAVFSYFRGLTGYALRNAPFFAGYALDLARLPREWMPYNRVVLRLRLGDADIVEGAPFPPAQAARVPAVPAEVSRRLAGVSRGYACWVEGGWPTIRPAFW